MEDEEKVQKELCIASFVHGRTKFIYHMGDCKKIVQDENSPPLSFF